MRNFPKIEPIGPQPIYYKPNCCSDQQTSFRIDYNPKVSETSGKERSQFEARFNSYITPERKPNPFYPQQDKIIYFREPLYNDTYHLDVSNVSVEKTGIRGNMNIPHDQYKSLRDHDLISPGIPMKIETNKYYNTQIECNRPFIGVADSKNVNPTNGIKTSVYTTQAILNPNRDASLVTNIVPTLHQPSTTPSIKVNIPAPYKKPFFECNLPPQPHSRVNGGRAFYNIPC